MTRPTTDPWEWWYRLVAVWVGTTFVLVGVALTIGPPRWTTGNSLQKLHDHSHIPWPVWGAVFFALALGILWARSRFASYFIGAIIAGWFVGISILFSVAAGKFTNPVTVGMGTLAVPLLLAGARYSLPRKNR